VSHKSLEALIQAVGGPVSLLRNSQSGPYVYPVVPSEFSNWRDEQRAWQQTCVLFNQSYHMTDMYVSGRDTLKLLAKLGINSFAGFGPNKAKQYVVCSPDSAVSVPGPVRFQSTVPLLSWAMASKEYVVPTGTVTAPVVTLAMARCGLLQPRSSAAHATAAQTMRFIETPPDPPVERASRHD